MYSYAEVSSSSSSSSGSCSSPYKWFGLMHFDVIKFCTLFMNLFMQIELECWAFTYVSTYVCICKIVYMTVSMYTCM